jgi:Ca-activated chloride channel family protein
MDATTLTARKVRITLTCGPGVRPIGAIGRKALQKGGTSIEVSIDNLYGDEKYALFEIDIPASEKAASLDAAKLKLEYFDPATESVVVLESALKLRQSADGGEIESNRRYDVISQAEIARNAEAREEAIRLADEGRAQEAAKILGARASAARMQMAAAPMSSEIESDAQDLEDLSEILVEQNNMSSEVRKKVLNDAYIQQNQQKK